MTISFFFILLLFGSDGFWFSLSSFPLHIFHISVVFLFPFLSCLLGFFAIGDGSDTATSTEFD